MIVIIECPRCGFENEYDDDDDTVLCEECQELIFVYTDEELQTRDSQ